MKNIMIIIGTIILGGLIVTTMILGTTGDTLQAGAIEIVGQGVDAVQAIDWTGSMPQ